MNHIRHWLVLSLAAGFVILPWACSKSFEVSPMSPAPAATATSTVNPAFTATDTPTMTQSPTPGFTPTSTPTFTDMDFDSGVTVLPAGAYQFGCVHIGGGATVTIQGAVTVYCTCFTLDAGATLTGVGMGYGPKSYINPYADPGPGGGSDGGYGQSCGALCTGGGHGGVGGTYSVSATLYGSLVTCAATSGGRTNDDPIHPAFMGSAGGWPNGGNGQFCFGMCGAPTSYGGGLLWIVVYDPNARQLRPATINGVVDMSGAQGGPAGPHAEYSGCGAGGGLLVESSLLSGTGSLNANGGGYQSRGNPPTLGLDNGGGGGGIISLISDTSAFSGTTSVLNGPNAQPGIVSVTAPPSSGY
ncbi:MAG TPA: hypothetical protein VMU88_05145 [bacterium]|nr:hypothetical protein [bacterium]